MSRILRVLCIALLCVGVGEAQSRDNSLNLHHLYLPMDGHGFYVVDDPHTLRQGEVALGVNFSHAHNLLELGIPGDTRTLRLSRQLSVIDVAGAVGLFDGVSLGVALPVVVDHDGRELLNLNSDVRGEGFGAARVQLKATLFERRGEKLDFAIALKPFFTLPTGRNEDLLNDNSNPTGGAMILAELRFMQRFRLGAEIGYEAISSDADVGDLEIVDRIRFGAALEFLLLRADEPELEPLPQSRWLGSPAWSVVSHQTWSGDEVSRPDLLRTYDALVFAAVTYSKDGQATLKPRERALLDAARDQFELTAAEALVRERRVRAADPADLDLKASNLDGQQFLFEGVAEMVACDGEVSWDEKLALRRVAHANGVALSVLRRAVEHAESKDAEDRGPRAWLLPGERDAQSASDKAASFGHTLALGGEVYGWTNSDRPFHNERERPIEAGGYLRYAHSSGFFLRAGVAIALNNGIGAPDVRYLAGGGWRF